jgi:hypothetical protein
MTSTDGWQAFPDLNSAPAEVIFRLPASHGRVVALDDYRQRQGLCLLFLPDDEAQTRRGHLEALAAARGDLSERDAAPLAVLPGDQKTAAALAATLSQPLLVLADADGRVRQRYLALAPDIDPDAAFIFLLDRWGAPLAVGPVEEDWIGEALAWFDLALARCPE